jgi:hypothetical protein
MAMARMIAVFGIGDYDAWKQRFDADPVGRDELATGYSISRGVGDPSEVLLMIEFASVADGEALLERLASAPLSPAEEEMSVKVFPTIYEIVEGA